MQEHRKCDKCEHLCNCRYRDTDTVEDCDDVIEWELEHRTKKRGEDLAIVDGQRR